MNSLEPNRGKLTGWRVEGVLAGKYTKVQGPCVHRVRMAVGWTQQ